MRSGPRLAATPSCAPGKSAAAAPEPSYWRAKRPASLSEFPPLPWTLPSTTSRKQDVPESCTGLKPGVDPSDRNGRSTPAADLWAPQEIPTKVSQLAGSRSRRAAGGNRTLRRSPGRASEGHPAVRAQDPARLRPRGGGFRPVPWPIAGPGRFRRTFGATSCIWRRWAPRRRRCAAASELRFFFKVTPARIGFGEWLATVRKEDRLPEVFSPEEVALLLQCAPSLKHRAALSVAYPRPLLRSLEQGRRPALAHHVHRTQRLGPWVLISAGWYQRASGSARTAAGGPAKSSDQPFGTAAVG